jgi:hypothetical protein
MSCPIDPPADVLWGVKKVRTLSVDAGKN